MRIRRIPGAFSILQLASFEGLDQSQPFVFCARTDEEFSVVCPAALADSLSAEHILDRNDGWALYGIEGTLDFSLIGVIANITQALAAAQVSVFVVSTFATDYFLIRLTDTQQAEAALGDLIQAQRSHPLSGTTPSSSARPAR